MSRIGRKVITIPQAVQVTVDGSTVKVKGPRGELERSFHPQMTITLEDGQLSVARSSDERQQRALHGLTRALLANMIAGVTDGFRKVLVIDGVGYRAEQLGKNKVLMLYLGYSHPIIIQPPDGITLTTDARARTITIEGIDRELVGELAAKIRGLRPPEPYKGKGIRYDKEVIRRKAGKAKVG